MEKEGNDMNWKNEAIDKLEQYEAKKQCLVTIPGQINMLESAASRLRSTNFESPGVKSTKGRTEDMLLNNIVQREELNWSLEQARQWVDQVESGLSILTQEERMILDRFYIYGEKGAADILAGDLCVDVKTVYRRKDAALRRFTIALWGCVES